ncbi:PAS domain S-box protein [Rhodopirellula sp. P2]|uniref:PAS domain S-box protein n=1 Tax=Rhodopirellula sp. P2 TaxID=2127060 RepID=UPI0023688399|nr:PAS domain S-box protein [Rhodopirellula sp. P2]WDQ15251.1 PAS domain S-box protein [Rhodopirellula sp. P2]
MQRTILLSLLIAVIGVFATVATVEMVRRSALRHDQQRFEHMADRLQGEFQRRMQQSELGLIAVQCLFSANEQVQYADFIRLLSRIDPEDEFLGAEAFGYLEVVPDTPEATQQLSEELVASGLAPLRVTTHKSSGLQFEGVGSGRLIPGRFIIKFVQPNTRFDCVVGLDLGEDRLRRETAERSARTGKACITPRLQLMGSGPDESGFLFMMPHYRGNPRTEEERLKSIVGWVGMVIDGEAVFENLETATGNELGYKLSIQEGGDSQFELASGPADSTKSSLGFQRRTSERIAGQQWIVEVFPTKDFATTVHSLVWTIAFGGGCFTLVISILVLTLSSNAYRAQKIASHILVDLRRLAMVAERTTNEVVITDVNRRITWVNEGFIRNTGYQLSEVEGQCPGDLLQCSETDLGTLQLIREALGSQKGFCGELLNQRKDGSRYWVYLDIQPLLDDDGEHIGYLAIKNDITETHEAAAKVKRVNERIEYALDGGQMSIWDWDISKGKIVYDSRGYGITGHRSPEGGDPAEVWFERIHPEDLAHVEAEINQCISGEKEGFLIEWRCANEHGDFNWLFARGHVVQRDETGQATHLAGTTMEINERKRVELALIESQKRSQAVFNSSQDAIMFLSKGEILDCNPRTLELFGFESISEMARFEIVSLSPEFQPDGKRSDVEGRKIMELLDSNGKIHFEWTHMSQEGRCFDCDISVVSFNLSGQVYQQAVLRDISTKKEMQRQLSQTQKLESIGQLAAGVAHEINTPMQCVFGNVEYLNMAFDNAFQLINTYRELRSDSQPSDFAKAVIQKAESSCRFDSLQSNITESIQEAHDAANRVIDIVRAMKTMSHPGTSAKTTTDLNQLIRDATIVARNHWKYVARLNLDLDETVHSLPIFPAQLSQVILNLVVNSADAIEEEHVPESSDLGVISVSTEMVGSHVRITVTDTGTGMPESIRRRVFDPFFTTKDVGKGTGQGLAIAYDVVVNQHGGTIQVDSTPGQGACFTILLPVEADTTTVIGGLSENSGELSGAMEASQVQA